MGKTQGENELALDPVCHRRDKRRKPRGPKTARHLVIHAKKRAIQRFAMALTDDEIHGIGNTIREGRATFTLRQSRIVTLWVVTVRGQDVAVAYDRKRKAIRTIMPTEYLGRTTKGTK